jgi:phospholipid/cholesterol/gamma-HCH transport system substrate-binding protein
MLAKKHEFTMTELKAGLTVIVGAAVFVLFLAAISGMRPEGKTVAFATEFVDTGGLNVGGDVRFGGMKVGRVTSIAPSPKDHSLIRVDFKIDAKVPLNEACQTTISSVSIASDKHLEILTGAKDAALLAEGALVPARPGANDMFVAVGQVAEAVKNVLGEDGLIGDLRTMLGVKAAEKDPAKKLVPLSELLANVDKTVGEGKDLVVDMRGMVAERRKDLEQILKRVQDVGDGAKDLVGHLNGMLDENRGDIRGAVAGARKTIDRLAADMEEITKRLAAVLRNLESLSGETGDLVARNRPYLEDVLQDLREMMRNLKRFSEILSAQPHALIRGSTPEGRE